MIVMPTNNTGWSCGVLHGRFPNRLAHLHNPDRLFEPKMGIGWALDNGAYGAWQGGREWSEEPLYVFLERFAVLRPMWVAVPDVVTDRGATLRMWEKHSDRIAGYGVPLAFVVQDGMTLGDVPTEAATIFVGGSTAWKWRNLTTWVESGKSVHVGRVNTYRHLFQAHDAGAASADGTGFFRGGPARLTGLIRYLEESNKGHRPQLDLPLCE